MSTVMKELKAEISRLARREVRKALAPVQRVSAARRGQLADVRRQKSALQTELKALRKAVAVAAVAPEKAGPEERFWITGKGVRSLRKRLGLTQAKLGRLAGVSIQTIVNWEGTSGKVSLRRKETIARMREIRRLNKRTAAEQLKPRSKKSAA